MHHSTASKANAQAAGRQKWQEPAILVERSLLANAQEGGPDFGPAFGPFSTTTVIP